MRNRLDVTFCSETDKSTAELAIEVLKKYGHTLKDTGALIINTSQTKRGDGSIIGPCISLEFVDPDETINLGG